MRLPLFPLSSHLLPNGRLALRIFEPRYIRMVKQACADSSGFVMCMINPDGDKSVNTHVYTKGTYCEVIDFDVLKDGLLGITVEGKYCVDLTDILTEHDGLRVADCTRCELWHDSKDIGDIRLAAARLREIFEKYPEVSGLYGDNLPFDDSEWVINRWIELLPLAPQQKQSLMCQGNKSNVAVYLQQIIE